MPDLSQTYTNLPVAPLELIVLDSAKELGEQIDKHIVDIRKNGNYAFEKRSIIQGFCRDSYICSGTCPRFGTGEGKGVFDETVRGKDLFILVDVCNNSITYRIHEYVNHYSPDDNYQDLKRVIAAVSGCAKRVNVIMPFLYEGRQHNRTTRESLDCALMLEELYKMGVDNFITFDAHDPRVANAIPLNGFDNYIPPVQFMNALLDSEKDLLIDKEHLVVISPDEGALDRAIYYANVLGVNTGMFYKRRDYTRIINGKNPIVAHEFLGDDIDGKDVIIIDDMISSGESMIDTAKQIKAMNAKRVYICCTFALFNNGLKAFDNAFERAAFDKIIISNLCYVSPEALKREYVIQADLSRYLAEIIVMMNHDVSMSNIHETSDDIREIIDKYNRE